MGLACRSVCDVDSLFGRWQTKDSVSFVNDSDCVTPSLLNGLPGYPEHGAEVGPGVSIGARCRCQG